MYGVHPYLKVHSGGMMLLGKVAVSSKSRSHRITSRRSTESEIIGVDDNMPGVISTFPFLKGQFFKVNKNIVYQGNQSAIFVERRGKYLFGNKTRHIDIRYFFITDRIE